MFGIWFVMLQWLVLIFIIVNCLYNVCVLGVSGYFFGQCNYYEEFFVMNWLIGSEVCYKLFWELYIQQLEIQFGGVMFEWLVVVSVVMWQIE